MSCRVWETLLEKLLFRSFWIVNTFSDTTCVYPLSFPTSFHYSVKCNTFSGYAELLLIHPFPHLQRFLKCDFPFLSFGKLLLLFKVSVGAFYSLRLLSYSTQCCRCRFCAVLPSNHVFIVAAMAPLLLTLHAVFALGSGFLGAEVMFCFIWLSFSPSKLIA